jgi:hypothetical protein
LTIDNNVTRQQTDDFVPYDVVAGQRQVSLSFDLIFETLTEYNKFHYGSARRHHAVEVDLHHLGRLPVRQRREQPGQVHAPVHRLRGVPGRAEHGGDPITATVRAVAQRPSSGSIITATVKNQVATY